MPSRNTGVLVEILDALGNLVRQPEAAFARLKEHYKSKLLIVAGDETTVAKYAKELRLAITTPESAAVLDYIGHSSTGRHHHRAGGGSDQRALSRPIHRTLNPSPHSSGHQHRKEQQYMVQAIAEPPKRRTPNLILHCGAHAVELDEVKKTKTPLLHPDVDAHPSPSAHPARSSRSGCIPPHHRHPGPFALP